MLLDVNLSTHAWNRKSFWNRGFLQVTTQSLASPSCYRLVRLRIRSVSRPKGGVSEPWTQCGSDCLGQRVKHNSRLQYPLLQESGSITPSGEPSFNQLEIQPCKWLDLLAVQGTLKSLLQHHSSKASILQHSAFFTIQLSHPYMTSGKNHSFDYMDLCWQSNVSAF